MPLLSLRECLAVFNLVLYKNIRDDQMRLWPYGVVHKFGRVEPNYFLSIGEVSRYVEQLDRSSRVYG